MLAELEALQALAGPVDDGLTGAEAARLAALLGQRAQARVARGDSCALADLDRARALGAAPDDATAREARTLRALAQLRHSDPQQRDRGGQALAELARDGLLSAELAAAARAAGDAATRADLGAGGLALWQRGARRAGQELLDRWDVALAAAVARGEAAPVDGAIADAWLAARAWWRGPGGRPDRVSLERAIAAGASPCHFAVDLGEHGCSAAAAVAAGDEPAPWEAQLVARARDRGWRTADADEAAAWVAVTLRAWQAGRVASWLDELDARVDLAALGVDADDDDGAARLDAALPAWARPTLLRLAGRGDEAGLARDRAEAARATTPRWAVAVLDAEAALAAPAAAGTGAPADPGPSEVIAVVAAALTGASPAQRDDLRAVAQTYAVDRAAADRVAADRAAATVDAAALDPALGELFLLLDDPARARAVWQRAVDACPGDPALLAGLVRAAAATGDGAAAVLWLTSAAAASGDTGQALLAGAQVLHDAGLTIDALLPAKQAIELAPPGARADALALALALVTTLGRPDQIDAFTAALADERAPAPGATRRARAHAGDAAALAAVAAADPADGALAVLAARGATDPAAIARLTEAARRDPRALAPRVALAGAADPDAAAAAVAALAALAIAPGASPGARRAALRAYLVSSGRGVRPSTRR